MDSYFRKVLVTEDFHAYLKGIGRELVPLVDRLIPKLERFASNRQMMTGPSIRQLEEGMFKARLSHDLRIPFTLESDGDGLDLCLGPAGSHSEGESWHRNPPRFDSTVVYREFDQKEDVDIEPDRWHIVRHVRRLHDGTWQARRERNPEASLRLSLSPQQEKIARQAGPVLLRGGAGSGKTTVALYRLLLDENPAGNRLYVTYTPQLKRHAARQFAELADPDVSPPRFLTIEELCREIIGERAAEHFRAEHRMTSSRFRTRFGRHHGFLGKNPETIWEDILGAIKGSEELLLDPEQTWLSFEAYRASERCLAENPQQVYQEFIDYRQLPDIWDDVDLARTAWQTVLASPSGIQKYQDLVVDEVQDLTAFHLGLILKLAERPESLFLAGDTHQSIHPSRFDWRLTRMLFHRLHGTSLDRQSIHTLTTNHRSPEPVVTLVNAISRWRRETWDQDDAYEVETAKDGAKLRLLGPEDIENLPNPEHISTRLMIIVPDEASQEQARLRFGDALVYTIPEAKGLESDFVMLLGVLSHDRKVWEKGTVLDDRFRMRINRLTVALTRCLEELFVVDSFTPLNWTPWQSAEWTTDEEARAALHRMLKVAPEDVEAIAAKAEINEDRGNLVQAAALFRRIGRPLDAARCLEGLENWREAARCFEDAGRHDRAAQALEKALLWHGAAQQHLKARAPLEAGRCLSKAGQHSQALKLYIAEGAWEAAARCQEHLRQWTEAARNFRRAGLPGDQGRLLLKVQAYSEALQVFREINDVRGQAQALEGMEELEQAVEAYRDALDWASVARLANSLGWPLDAAEAHARASNHASSAKIYASIGEWFEASQQYREAGNLMSSGWCLEQMEAWRDAARTYEEAALLGAMEVAERKGRAESAFSLKGLDVSSEEPDTNDRDAWLTGFLRASRCFGNARMSAAERRCRNQQVALGDRDWKAMALELERGHRWREASTFHRASGNVARTAWCLEEASEFQEAAIAWLESRHFKDQDRCLKLARLHEARDSNAMGEVYREQGQFDRALVHFLVARNTEAILEVYLEAIVRHVAGTGAYSDHVTPEWSLKSQILDLWEAQNPRTLRDFMLNRRNDGFIVAAWLAGAMEMDSVATLLMQIDQLSREGAWSAVTAILESRRPGKYTKLLGHLEERK